MQKEVWREEFLLEVIGNFRLFTESDYVLKDGTKSLERVPATFYGVGRRTMMNVDRNSGGS